MNGALYGGVGVGGMNGAGALAAQVERWSACERTVVCVWLARRVPGRQLRLLQRAVDAALRRQPPPVAADAAAERAANDPRALQQALQPHQHDDDGVEKLQQLLDMVPLLRTDNEEAKEVYMSMVPGLVQRCVDSPRRSALAPDLCRQLLSYLLVHPALTHEDQRTLTQWLRYLESHMSGSMSTETLWPQRIEPGLLTDNIWGTNNAFRRTIGKNVEFRGIADPLEASFTTDSQESFSKNGRDVEISLEGEKLNFEAAIAQPKQRSNSLTPPSSLLQPSSSAENLYEDSFVKPRSFSLSLELGQGLGVSGLRCMAGGGSETRLERRGGGGGRGWRPGMAAVPHWLKALRLHKYLWLFTNLTYDQMMAMDDKYLEKLGVTRGARHKLLVSIAALHERGAALQAAHAALQASSSGTSTSGGSASIVRALDTLKGVLLSPLAPDSPLPAALVAALETASATLCSERAEGGSGGGATRGAVAGAGGAVGGGTGAAAPTTDEEQHVDPLSLHCWLVERALHHESFSSPQLQSALRRLRHRLPPSQFYRRVCSLGAARRHPRPKWRPPVRPPPPPPPPPTPPPAVDYCSLDALCLQMTHHAID